MTQFENMNKRLILDHFIEAVTLYDQLIESGIESRRAIGIIYSQGIKAGVDQEWERAKKRKEKRREYFANRNEQSTEDVKDVVEINNKMEVTINE